MAFPTTSILDDFTRADANNLGSSWTDRSVQDHLEINGNRVAENGSGNFGSSYWNVATYGPDCEAYYSVPVLPGGSNYVRLYLRLTSPGVAGETGYMAQWNNSSGLIITRENSKESFTNLSSDSAARFVADDQIGFSAVGSTLTVYKNGTAVLTATDSTYSSAGYLAIGMRSWSGRIDDFGGGTIVTPSAFVPRVILL